uniref:hypothetical protein n=1 Tax=Cupriavidus gilardii TaxID=82541 RepID=UPI00247AB17C|nr:hypothetical protein [Cupriavidus gilardii]WDE72714.1 hypothetical protein [Cupriavidus gilardii]
MKKVLLILAFAPVLARAELILLDPQALPPGAEARAVNRNAALPPVAMSGVLDLTVMREGRSLLLLFRTAPERLFVSDAKTGSSVTEADWLTDRSVRVLVGSASSIEIKTDRGRVVLQLDGVGVAIGQEGPAA